MDERIGQFLRENTWQLALFALLFLVIQRMAAAVPTQRTFRRGALTDLVLSYGVVLLCVPIYAPTMRWIAATLQAHAQFEWLYRSRVWVDELGIVPAFILALVLGDLLSYWRHRLFHLRWLWPLHAIHHGSEEVDWLSNERFHPLDHVSAQLLQASAFLAIGFDPGIVAAHAAVRRTNSLFIHSNVGISYGWLDRIFVSPNFHRWHHAADARTIDRNFAAVFSGIDWMFGTWARPTGELPARYGLLNGSPPTGVLGMLVDPFKQMWAMAAGAPLVQPSLPEPDPLLP
jgi:sterol desaturase/sphingolipid hydroxylase (fatty acid hydroxylase superfamily)